MKDRTEEITPSGVPQSATHDGGNRDRWSWVEPLIWTERMLTALEQGVKGGKWFSDHNRWPNAYFAERGLFSLSAAYRAACQSSPR